MAVHNVLARVQLKTEIETTESNSRKDNYRYCNI
jgi:hypothetical protein